MLGPRGEILPLPVSALSGWPFDTYFAPGLILFGVLGLGPLVAALLVWIRHPLAPFAKAIANPAKRGVRDVIGAHWLTGQACHREVRSKRTTVRVRWSGFDDMPGSFCSA